MKLAAQARLLPPAIAAAAAPLIAGCEAAPSVLDPRGPAASEVAVLWWTMLVMSGVVVAGVMAVLLLALFRPRRPGQKQDTRATADGTMLIVIGGVVLPAIILVSLFFLTVRAMAGMAMPGGSSNLTIEVVGHQFWWEIHYPEAEVITANEIHIPVGEPVEVHLTSVDVIHSFWVPQLQGKLDLVPGRTNTTWIQAAEPGTYRGICAEYCGIQHAHMQFLVIAEPPAEFAAWLQTRRQPAPEPVEPLVQEGWQIFQDKACAACHRVQGMTADGTAGPDLTHFASRRTIAAAMIENNPANRIAWITEPQRIKPGNSMPDVRLEPDELEALMAFIETLE